MEGLKPATFFHYVTCVPFGGFTFTSCPVDITGCEGKSLQILSVLEDFLSTPFLMTTRNLGCSFTNRKNKTPRWGHGQ